jgi:hypothetical protein
MPVKAHERVIEALSFLLMSRQIRNRIRSSRGCISARWKLRCEIPQPLFLIRVIGSHLCHPCLLPFPHRHPGPRRGAGVEALRAEDAVVVLALLERRRADGARVFQPTPAGFARVAHRELLPGPAPLARPGFRRGDRPPRGARDAGRAGTLPSKNGEPGLDLRVPCSRREFLRRYGSAMAYCFGQIDWRGAADGVPRAGRQCGMNRD